MTAVKTGFTLVEMLLATAVMVTLISFSMARYMDYSRQSRDKAGIAQAAQVLGEAKANAVAGKTDCSVCGGADKKCNGIGDSALAGWRAYFADTNGNNLMDMYTIEGKCGSYVFMKRTEELVLELSKSGPCDSPTLMIFLRDGTLDTTTICTLKSGDHELSVDSSGVITVSD